MSPARILLLGVALVIVGFILVAVGALSGPGVSTSTGGFVLIGPIPIVFGSGPNSGLLAGLGVVITVAVLVFYVVSLLVWRSGRRREAESAPNPNS